MNASIIQQPKGCFSYANFEEAKKMKIYWQVKLYNFISTWKYNITDPAFWCMVIQGIGAGVCFYVAYRILREGLAY